MKFKEYNQKQVWLIPPNIEDEIPKGDLCRVIDEVIEAININCIENKYREEGNPAYHPRMMLKLLFYSYSRKVFSSRKIAQELERNIYYWYLTGKQKPDFRTINLFRLRHGQELKLVFEEIVRLCIRLGLADVTTVAIDSTKIKASANRDKLKDKDWLDRKIRENTEILRQSLDEADRIDREEDELYGDKRGDELPEELRDQKKRLELLRKLKEEMEQTQQKTINLTDKDAKLIKSGGKFSVGYNCQSIVDSKHQVIVAADISESPNDWNELKPMVEGLKESQGKIPQIILADAGYFSGSTLKYLKKERIDGYIPDKAARDLKEELAGKIADEDRYSKEYFKYSKEKDLYRCPEGKALRRTTSIPLKVHRKGEGLVHYFQYQCRECRSCGSREKCTNNLDGRTINRYADEALREEMAKKMRTGGYAIYKQRMKIIEAVFGNIKQNLGFREFSLRGLIKTRGEFFLIATAHNLLKIKNWMNKTKTEIGGSKLGYSSA